MFSVVTVEAATPPGGIVSDEPITADELLMGTTAPGLTNNDRFVPIAQAKPARQKFIGTLQFDGAPMQVLSAWPGGGITNPVLGKDTTFFPDVAIDFFTVDGRLVPTTQDVIRNGILPETLSFWDIIVQPGRVWSEPGDGNWNRASFPFSLVNSLEGETHMGIALFLYRGRHVSPVRFQIVQMTSPYYVWDLFSAWGTSGAQYKPGGIGHVGKRKREFRAEQAAQLPVLAWGDLENLGVDSETLDAFTSYPDVIQSAVVHEGVLYRTDCPTAAGPFPYCDEVRYGVWSVTKSSMMNVAMLRLAQKYGADFIDQSIAVYLPVIPTDDRWGAVTFRDMANMASGFGPNGAPTCYLCDYDRWYIALSMQDKTAEALDYVWFESPGTLFNYRDQDAYLLGVALDGFLKAHEGPDATVRKMLRTEVYRPIGIFHAPTNTTVEPDGVEGHALMAYGHYPTIDDLAKIALLYENHGNWNGEQLLDSTLVNKLLPQATPPAEALSASSDGSTYYLTNWWLNQMESDDGCTRYLSYMQGWGGKTVTLAPQETVVLRIRNYFDATPNPRESITDLIDELTSVCE